MCVWCATGMAFTCSNVLTAVRTVENWWSEYGGLRYWLYIPEEKMEEIQRVYSDPEEQKRQLILYWMSTDPLASWRRLITQLDWMDQSPVADAIRDFAEPLAAGTVYKSINKCTHMTCTWYWHMQSYIDIVLYMYTCTFDCVDDENMSPREILQTLSTHITYDTSEECWCLWNIVHSESAGCEYMLTDSWSLRYLVSSDVMHIITTWLTECLCTS